MNERTLSFTLHPYNIYNASHGAHNLTFLLRATCLFYVRTAVSSSHHRHVGGGSTGGPRDTVMAVLRDPPKKVPRSPTLVKATLAERSCLEPEEAVSPVEVRWRVPSQASLAPASCGDVERYYVKCWCRGKGKEVIRSKTSTVDVPRRDFCRNQVRQRGGVLCCRFAVRCMLESVMACSVGLPPPPPSKCCGAHLYFGGNVVGR